MGRWAIPLRVRVSMLWLSEKTTSNQRLILYIRQRAQHEILFLMIDGRKPGNKRKSK
ncbi:hypothetical protein CJ030_MR5G024522 [Morella rubra]|uniref:Uncharacterized protein n=1 Tax=Morella rubra TaxID=262757 RepID=A0A6A1VWF4_9ROSI|nr:hypothetical protein CJ030_MR5G024522 [Morella rubra]